MLCTPPITLSMVMQPWPGRRAAPCDVPSIPMLMVSDVSLQLETLEYKKGRAGRSRGLRLGYQAHQANLHSSSSLQLVVNQPKSHSSLQEPFLNSFRPKAFYQSTYPSRPPKTATMTSHPGLGMQTSGIDVADTFAGQIVGKNGKGPCPWISAAR